MVTSPIILLDAVRKERLKRDAETSLMAFTEQAFSIVEPGIKFRGNWHLNVICEHLEAVSLGEINNLLINIPPGTMKSILVSVCWPAWEWLNDPSLRYMGASYGADLAIRDASKCRDIILSEWYQERWPGVRIKAGSDQKTKYELTGGGWRMSTSVGGRATGEHPDRKIVDDPHNAKQAESEAERESALTWFDRTLSTRGESRGARTVVVMQRLHERDLSGHILADITGYEHVCIPMEYESKRKATSIGWVDPRTVKGDLLWPSMFPVESVARLKTVLGSYGSAGQLQQRPAPEGGGILKVDRFQLWPSAEPMPRFEYVLQSYDTAFTTKTDGDPSACTVWGVFTHKNLKCAMLLDAWAEHMGYPALRARLLKEWKSKYGGDPKDPINRPRRADGLIIEKKASGQSLLQDLNTSGIPAFGYDPGRSDKIARAHQTAPVLELEVLYVPESRKNPGTPMTWAQDFLSQCERFPRDEHDDYVDTFTQAMIYLRDSGWFDLDYTEPEPLEEYDYYANKRKGNPYAA